MVVGRGPWAVGHGRWAVPVEPTAVRLAPESALRSNHTAHPYHKPLASVAQHHSLKASSSTFRLTPSTDPLLDRPFPQALPPPPRSASMNVYQQPGPSNGGSSKVWLDLRGTRISIERESLMELPESVLLCLFPNGVVLSPQRAQRIEGQSEDDQGEDIYFVDVSVSSTCYSNADMAAIASCCHPTRRVPRRLASHRPLPALAHKLTARAASSSPVRLRVPRLCARVLHPSARWVLRCSGRTAA